MHRNNLLHQSFRISYHYAGSRIVGQPIQHFGSQNFVGSVELTQFYCFFERRRKIKYFVGREYLFKVVVKITGIAWFDRMEAGVKEFGEKVADKIEAGVDAVKDKLDRK